MIDGVCDVVGKTISGVVVKAGTAPVMQVFLLFSDDTYYEFYSNDGRIEGTTQVYEGTAGLIRNENTPSQHIVMEAFTGVC